VGLPITAQLPLPRIRLRQVTTSAIVWDGQTVVLGGLISVAPNGDVECGCAGGFGIIRVRTPAEDKPKP